MNQSNSTIELYSSSQPEIRHGRVPLYMKSVRGEMYSIYLMHFSNGIFLKLDTFRQLLPTKIDLFSALSNSIHTLTELIPNSSKHFFGSFNRHLNRQKILKEKNYLRVGGSIPWKMIQTQTNTNLLGQGTESDKL